MSDLLYLVTVNCFIIFTLIKLSEKRINKLYLKKYGASTEEFSEIIKNFNDFNLKLIPKPMKENKSVFNELLILNSNIIKIKTVLSESKNKAIEISDINKRMISSYLEILTSLRKTILEFEEPNSASSDLIFEVVNKIDLAISCIDK